MASSAEELGQRWLEKVHEEDLCETLKSLGHEQSRQPFRHINVAPIDKLLDTFEPRSGGTNQAPVIELVSVTACTGKTHLLYHLIALAVLPLTHGGRAGCAVVLDADGRFEAQRLAQVMLHDLQRRAKQYSSDSEPVLKSTEFEEHYIAEVSESLRHVHIFRPQSLPALVSTAQQLPYYLSQDGAHSSGSRKLEIVALDSATAFFWQDKLEGEELQVHNPGGAIPRSGYDELVSSLRSLQSLFGCTIVATSWGFSKSTRQREAATSSYRPTMPASWQAMCDIRLVMERKSVRKYPNAMTLEEIVRDRPMRQSVVDEGIFWVWLDQWRSDSWPESTRSALHGIRTFELRISQDGVEI